MPPNNLNDDNKVTYFATTDARNRKVPFGIKAKDRSRHVYTIGKTGMGKSTLLENMAIQDIQNGEGLAFLDPHGKTAEYILDFVPENRVKDVLYFAPFDMDYPIAFNVMEDVGVDKRHLVVSGLMSAFKKIWVDAWSARMEYILQYALLALLEYPGATLLAINKMLSDKEFRKKVVENITDPTVKSFWIDEFAKYTDRFAAEATPAIQNKVGQFTSNPLIRNIIGQAKSSFDIRKMMDEKKIIIINLSKGRVGESNANLLGSMLITKIYLAAMSRADMSEKMMARQPNFYLYVDEFQSFANESFADILSEARKYKLNLTIAHQYIEQMEEQVRAAVFGNVGTMIVFRVGPFDAEIFEKEFLPRFTAEDFVNLGFAQVYLKLMIDGVSSQPFSATTMPPMEKPPISYKEQVIEMSRKQFSRARIEVEKQVAEQTLGSQGAPPPNKEYKEKPRYEQKREEFKKEYKKIDTGESKPYVKYNEPPRKQTADGSHISALRGALAGVLGETNLSGPKEKGGIKSQEPEKPKQNFPPKPEQYSPPSASVGKTKEEEEKEASQNKFSGNAANRQAFEAVLEELKQKEKGGQKKEEISEKTNDSAKEKNISEKDLRSMLHVEEEK